MFTGIINIGANARVEVKGCVSLYLSLFQTNYKVSNIPFKQYPIFYPVYVNLILLHIKLLSNFRLDPLPKRKIMQYLSESVFHPIPPIIKPRWIWTSEIFPTLYQNGICSVWNKYFEIYLHLKTLVLPNYHFQSMSLFGSTLFMKYVHIHHYTLNLRVALTHSTGFIWKARQLTQRDAQNLYTKQK